MNKNTSTWVFECPNSETSEVVQRLAFSLGYTWRGNNTNTVKNVDAKFLFFHPPQKHITWGNYRETVEEESCEIVKTVEGALMFLKNPPDPIIRPMAGVEIHKEFIDIDGNEYYDGEFSTIVNAWQKARGGPKTLLPKVSFVYTSENKGRCTRYVLVKKYTPGESIEGLDINDGFKYKKYTVNNITGVIVFDGFQTEQ